MHIVFVDVTPKDYTVTTPFERPLGGSQSACCYLTVELAKRGHKVTLLNSTNNPRDLLGIRCYNAKLSIKEVSAEHIDAAIVLNGPASFAKRLRRRFKGMPVILWTQHAANQRAMLDLKEPEVAKSWDHIVAVSDWHRRDLIEAYGLDPAKVSVQRNAIGPAFEGLFERPEDLLEAKSGPCILTYTSTPFRGLDALLSLFPEVHRCFPDAELHIYSSMKVYTPDESADQFTHLYDRSRQLAGAVYKGSVPQPELAEAMKTLSILAYPNTFVETSCIALMEALAAGLFVLTTKLGALPETTMGFGELVEPVGFPKSSKPFEAAYAPRLKTRLELWHEDPAAFFSASFEQVQAVNEQCTWRVRAQQWEELLLRIT